MIPSILRLALLVFAVGGPPTALAQSSEHFPTRPVKVIVAFAPGTGGDAVARIMSTAMGPLLGQPVVVDNRAGAGGVLGTEQGARAPADGYTLTLGTTSTLLTNPVLNPNVRYRAQKDFAPVAGVARTPFVILTANTPDDPRDIADLTKRLRAREGSFGSAGVGTVTHLAAELFLKQADVKAVHAPYRGSGPALTDLAAGQLVFGCDTVVAALPLIRAGRLRALAVTSGDRLASLPDVPTAAEAGFPQLKVEAWWGLVAPAGTPSAVVATLSDAAIKALATPEVKTQLVNQQLDAMPLPAAAFGKLIQEEQPFWAAFVQQTGIRVDF